MRRDARAYLADILESCDAIDAATAGMSLAKRDMLVLRHECANLVAGLEADESVR